MDKIYLFYVCDEWKSLDSMRLKVASTNCRNIFGKISEEISNNNIEFGSLCGKKGNKRLLDWIGSEIEDSSNPTSDEISIINNSLTYGYIQVVDDGEPL